MREIRTSERQISLDDRLNQLTQEGIFQPISAIVCPATAARLTYHHPRVRYTSVDFDFSRGTPPGLPLMIGLGEKKKRPDSIIYCRPDHLRTGLLTSKSGIFFDDTPMPYLDEKGIGQLLEELASGSRLRYQYVRSHPPQSGSFGGKPVTWGLADLDWVRHDAYSTNQILSAGVRIIPTIAFMTLSQIPDENGKFIPIAVAASRGLLASRVVPAIQFRAFVTPYRPSDLKVIETNRFTAPKRN